MTFRAVFIGPVFFLTCMLPAATLSAHPLYGAPVDTLLVQETEADSAVPPAPTDTTTPDSTDATAPASPDTAAPTDSASPPDSPNAMKTLHSHGKAFAQAGIDAVDQPAAPSRGLVLGIAIFSILLLGALIRKILVPRVE